MEIILTTALAFCQALSLSLNLFVFFIYLDHVISSSFMERGNQYI